MGTCEEGSEERGENGEVEVDTGGGWEVLKELATETSENMKGEEGGIIMATVGSSGVQGKEGLRRKAGVVGGDQASL